MQRMIRPGLHFWSYDLASKTWHNEESFINGNCTSNLPSSRQEFAVALVPAPPHSAKAGAAAGPPDSSGTRVVLFSGYTTTMAYGMDAFSYLADCFVWEKATGWKYVLTER